MHTIGAAAAFWRRFRRPESDSRPPVDLNARVSTRELIRILEAQLAVRPQSYAVHEQLGIACFREGLLHRALHHCLIALDLAETLDDRDDRRFVLSGAHANLAAVYAARGDSAAEWDALRAGLAVRPESGCLNYQMAVRLLADGDVEGALAALTFAVRDPRTYPREWFRRYAQEDRHFESLHRDPRFRQILVMKSAA